MSRHDELTAAYSDFINRPRTSLRASIRSVTDSPDQAANDLSLSQETGIPSSIVARNRDEVQRRAEMTRYDQLLKTSPVLANFLSDRENASVARDDVDNLGIIERALKIGSRATRNLYAGGTSRFSAGVYGVLEAGAEQVQGATRELGAAMSQKDAELRAMFSAAGFETRSPQSPADAAAFFRSLRQGQEAKAQQLTADNAEAGWFEQQVYSGVQSLGQNLPLMIGSAALRNPYLAAGAMSSLVFGEEYGTARDQGLDPGTAASYAAGQAAIEFLTEQIPMGKLIGDLEQNTGFVKMLVGQLISENIQEQVATHTQDFNSWMYLNPEKTVMDFIQERPQAFLATIISTTVAAGAQTGAVYGADRLMQRIVGDSDRANRADRNQQILRDLGEAAKNSKLRERSPERFEAYVRSLGSEIDSVSIPVDRFDEFFQSAQIDPEAMAADILGNRSAYAEAKASGGDLQIPLERYARMVAGTEYHDGLMQDIRLHPDDMTQRERQEWQEQADEIIKDFAAQLDKTPTNQPVYDNIVGQLLQTGMDQAAAEQHGLLMSSVIENLAQRTGVDAMQLYDRYGLSIQKNLPDILRQAGNVDVSIDPLIDRLRAGKIPTERDIFGDSLADFLKKNGGVQDQGGELGARDTAISLRGPVKDSGLSLDAAAELAAEAGYITDATEQALLDAIEREANGEPVFGNNADEKQQQLQAALTDLERYLSEAGVDLQTATNDEIRELLRNTEFFQSASRKAEPSWSDEFRSVGGEIAPDGTILVWHATTKDNAEKILRDGFLVRPEDAPDSYGVYFAAGRDAKSAAADYGDGTIIPVRVRAEDLSPDDVFPGRRLDFTAATKNGKYVPVAVGDAALQGPGNTDQSKLRTISRDALSDKGFDQSSALEPHMDAPGLSAEDLSNIFEGMSFSPEGDRLASVPSMQEVVTKVRAAALKDAQILDAIIAAIPVDVVNNLFGSELSAKVALHNEPVFKDGSALNADLSISDAVDAASPIGLLMRELALVAAKVRLGPSQAGMKSSERGAAVSADSIDSLSQSGPPNKPRAKINISTMTITLNENSDLTSALHEFGHFYFEVLADLAEAEGAPQQIVDDYKTLLKFAGVESRDQVQRVHHEKIAEAWETYLMEGKAPSIELQTVFARMRAWLVQVYRHLKGRGLVKLNDEVRGVFDRLVATDDAIAGAQESQNYVQLFTDAESAGMSPEQFAAYRKALEDARTGAEEDLGRKLLNVMTREQKKWWREQREQTMTAVTLEVRGMRVYKALSFLQRGQNPDGTPSEMTHEKLSKAILMDEFGYPQEFLSKLLGKGKSTIYSVEGGSHPDIVAGLFGYASGAEMIQDLANARPMDKLIKAETDARMREQFPDPLTDGSLADKAMTAVHSQKRAELLAAELRALRKKAREVNPFIRAEKRTEARQRREAIAANKAQMPDRDSLRLIKAAAERIIGSRQIRGIQPATYRNAEAKAARAAFAAAEKGDFQKAYFEKRKQILNHELFRAAEAAVEQSEKIRTYFKKFDLKRTREFVGKAGEGILEQIEAILADISLRKASSAAIDRSIGKRAVLELIAAGELTADPATIRRLEEAATKNWRELTYDEFVGMRDVVKQLEARARDLTTALIDGERRKIDEDAQEIADQILGAAKGVPVAYGEPTASERTASSLKSAIGTWLRSGNIARILDGSDWGAVTRRIIVPMRRAYAEKLIPMLQKSSEDVSALYLKHYTNKELAQLHKRGFAPGLSKSDVLSLALNWGNEENRKALLDGRDRNGNQPYDEATVRDLLSKLDARDWAFVQDVWDYLESYWPEASRKWKERRGVSPAKVEASPFTVTTSDGQKVELRGGYYPLVYDQRHSKKAAIREADEFFDKMFSSGFIAVTTRAGASHERVGSGGQLVRLGLGAIDRHLNEIIRDIALGDEVRYVFKLLNSGQVGSAANNTGQAEMVAELNRWLRDAAVGEILADNSIERGVGWVRTGFVKAKIGLKLTTTLLQITGFPQTWAIVGNKSFAVGMAEYLKNPAAARRRILADSKFMETRYRADAFNKDVQDTRTFLRSQMGYVPTVGKRVMDSMSAAYFLPLKTVQRVVDEVSWLAGFEKGRSERGLSDKDAGLYADTIVEQAQTSGFFTDRSSFERGTLGNKTRQSQFVRLWSVLIGYMLAKANNTYERGVTLKRKPSMLQAAKLGSYMVQAYVLEAILETLIRGQAPDDDEPYPWWLAKHTIDNIWAGIPFIREVSSAKYGGGSTPIGSLAHDVNNMLTQIGQQEVDDAMWKSIIDVGGTALHLPSGQANTMLDAYWRDVYEGEDVAPYEYLIGKRKSQ